MKALKTGLKIIVGGIVLLGTFTFGVGAGQTGFIKIATDR